MIQGVPLPPTPFPQVPTRADPVEIAIAIGMVIGSIGGISMLFILVRAWAQRIAHPKVEGEVLSPEVAELRDTVQHMSGQLAEVEERLDFAERLLARERDAERLKGPKA